MTCGHFANETQAAVGMQNPVSDALQYKINESVFLVFRNGQACSICFLMHDTKQEAQKYHDFTLLKAKAANS